MQPAILKRQILVGFILLLVVQDILHRIGIDASLGALVNAPRVEDGRLVVASRRVGGKANGIFAELYGTVHLFVKLLWEYAVIFE